MRPKLEVCVDSIESVLTANEAGVDRIELCAALEVGGLTPTIGFVRQIRESCPALSIFAMIRPRSGDFHYSPDEIGIMKKDIEVLKSNGINGFVFGVLRTDGTIDAENCRLLIETAAPLECTFHRAFDVVSDPKEALKQVIGLGFTRILTSGQSSAAINGMTNIKKLVEWSANLITIMAGAGVNEGNLEALLNETKVKEFHSSASVVKPSQMTYRNKDVSMGANTQDEYSLKVVSAEKVRKMIEIANKFDV